MFVTQKVYLTRQARVKLNLRKYPPKSARAPADCLPGNLRGEKWLTNFPESQHAILRREAPDGNLTITRRTIMNDDEMEQENPEEIIKELHFRNKLAAEPPQ